MHEKSYTNTIAIKQHIPHSLATVNTFMKIVTVFLCSLVVLNLAPLSLADNPAKTKQSAPARKIPLQGHIKKKGKFIPGKKATVKVNNPYSVARPYNPDNPPPIDNKIHPVSTNAR